MKHLFGIHIHAVDSNTPKNGPSAGSCFCVGIISRILNARVRCDVALTGEIELTGKVTKIGGLPYKLTGAKRAGIKLVLVSSENRDDIESIKKDYEGLIDDNFRIVLIGNIREALEHVLVDYDPSQII